MVLKNLSFYSICVFIIICAAIVKEATKNVIWMPDDFRLNYKLVAENRSVWRLDNRPYTTNTHCCESKTSYAHTKLLSHHHHHHCMRTVILCLWDLLVSCFKENLTLCSWTACHYSGFFFLLLFEIVSFFSSLIWSLLTNDSKTKQKIKVINIYLICFSQTVKKNHANPKRAE